MNKDNLTIRPLTVEEPVKPNEVVLKEHEAVELQNMNREQRRKWLKDQGRFKR